MRSLAGQMEKWQMITEEHIKGSLEAVLVPAAKHSIVGLNMVHEINISENGQKN